MDYWCALWFWPIDKADLLPDRDTFLMEIGLLLTGNVLDTRVEQGEMEFEESEILKVADIGVAYRIHAKDRAGRDAVSWDAEPVNTG